MSSKEPFRLARIIRQQLRDLPNKCAPGSRIQVRLSPSTMTSHESSELFDGVLMLVELTELAQRVPAGVRELWALDCARRAIASDIPTLRPQLAMLRACVAAARSWVTRTAEPESTTESAWAGDRDAFERAQQLARELYDDMHERSGNAGPGYARAVAAVSSLVWAMRCASGHPDHEVAARTAQAAFEHPDEEAGHQARRLMLRAKLIPSGAELLMRLDYAEARGMLPSAPEQRAWLDAQRELLMNEDENGRLAVVFRHFDRVFLSELARAR
jgi:hypothetical protein